jgi:outer membrane protein, multidrug efflux system
MARAMRVAWAAALLVLPAAGGAPPAAAATPPGAAGVVTPTAPTAAEPDTLWLGLEEALRIAARRSPALARARNQVTAAEADVRQGWGAFLPQARADVWLHGSTSRILTGQNEFGQPVRREHPLEYESSSAGQGVSLSLPLLDGGRRLQELAAARAGADAAAAAEVAEAARVRGALSRLYWRAVRAQQLIALEQRLLDSRRQQLAAAEQLLAVAGAAPEDVLGARAELARQELQVQRAGGEARKARLALREALGLAGAAEPFPADALPPAFAPDHAADALVAAALAESPRVRQREAQLAVARSRAGAMRAQRWPTLSLSAGLRRGMSLQSFDALRELNPRDRTLSFGLSAGLPLFSGFQLGAAAERAALARADAEHEAAATRLAVEREVRGALIDLEQAYGALRLAELSAALSLERLEMGRERYRLGAIPFTVLQEVADRGAAAERELVEVRFAFQEALLLLEERVGRELAPARGSGAGAGAARRTGAPGER